MRTMGWISLALLCAVVNVDQRVLFVVREEEVRKRKDRVADILTCMPNCRLLPLSFANSHSSRLHTASGTGWPLDALIPVAVAASLWYMCETLPDRSILVVL